MERRRVVAGMGKKQRTWHWQCSGQALIVTTNTLRQKCRAARRRSGCKVADHSQLPSTDGRCVFFGERRSLYSPCLSCLNQTAWAVRKPKCKFNLSDFQFWKMSPNTRRPWSALATQSLSSGVMSLSRSWSTWTVTDIDKNQREKRGEVFYSTMHESRLNKNETHTNPTSKADEDLIPMKLRVEPRQRETRFLKLGRDWLDRETWFVVSRTG